jgi:phage terminase large subunit-like protein
MTRPAGAYVAAAEAYVDDVLSGRRPACKYERLACERHRRDKRRSMLRTWPYRFDVDAAELACCFIEMLPHVKGQWAQRKELLHLEGWECFIVCSLCGWLVKAGFPRAGLRRFLEAYLEICRKNGKSVLAAAIGLYLWCMDGEAGAEVYSGATTEKQAWEVFRPARLMVEKSPDLIEELGGRPVRAKQLLVEEDQSRFEPMIGKPGDGASPHVAIIDEFHEHDTSDMVDTMRTGMLARQQPLLFKITTAGTNLAGPCYDQHLDVEKILEGTFENEQLFCIIYSIDLPEGDLPGTIGRTPSR